MLLAQKKTSSENKMHSVFALALMMATLVCSAPIPADKLQLEANEVVSLQKRAREQAKWIKGTSKNIKGAEVRGVTICRTQSGGHWNPGYVAEGKCHYGYAGKEVISSDYELLKSGKKFGWAQGTIYPYLITILSLDHQTEPKLFLLIIKDRRKLLFAERTVMQARRC